MVPEECLRLSQKSSVDLDELNELRGVGSGQSGGRRGYLPEPTQVVGEILSMAHLLPAWIVVFSISIYGGCSNPRQAS